jgi:hypothetical protein
MSYEEEDTYRRFFPSPCCLGCTSPGLVYSVKDLKLQPREETLNFLFFLIFFQKKNAFFNIVANARNLRWLFALTRKSSIASLSN